MKEYKTLSTKEKKAIIDKHFNKGISQARLADDYDVCRPQISKVCNTHGKSPLHKMYQMDDKEIVRLYVEEKKSVLQISKLLNTTPRPITRRLRLAGIEKKASQRYLWQETVEHYFLKSRIWAAKVIERDGLRCRMCEVENTYKNKLEAHHIVPVRDITDQGMLFEISNGITLCRKCHMAIHYREKEYEDIFRSMIRTTSFEDKKSH